MITWPYHLRAGHSDNPANGACAMDAINWLVHGEHGDKPACVCPIIRELVVSGNDMMPDDVRQRLLPYLHRIAGSQSRGRMHRRRQTLSEAVRIVLRSHARGLVNIPVGRYVNPMRTKTLVTQLLGVIPYCDWDEYFNVLDAVLNAGPQGEPWSVDVIEHGDRLFQAATGTPMKADA